MDATKFKRLIDDSGFCLIEDWAYAGTARNPEPELPHLKRLVELVLAETCQHLTNRGLDYAREQIERYWETL